jgi:hypothetical protein
LLAGLVPQPANKLLAMLLSLLTNPAPIVFVQGIQDTWLRHEVL